MPHVCPWWAAPLTIDPPFRRFLHDPQKIVGPYVEPGMTVMDVGCGVGYFSLPMARMVGEGGKVVAVDLQRQMLDTVRRRAEKAGIADRVTLHNCEQDRLGIDRFEVDFALVFAVLHEAPNHRSFLAEVRDSLKSGGKLLLAEPPLHVSSRKFAAESAAAEQVGFRIIARPRLRWSKAVLFERPA